MARTWWVGSAFAGVLSVGVIVGCMSGDRSPAPEPDADTETVSSALADSCVPACGASQMCCNGACVTRAVGPMGTSGRLAQISGATGCLEYRTYPNRTTSTPATDPGSVHTLPDFSYAGYMGGGKPIPWAPVKVEVTADGSDDRKTIQDAIDHVGAGCPRANGTLDCPMQSNGIRGAVFMRAGLYDLSDELVISKSGVVLRGDGQGSGGTTLSIRKKEPPAVNGPDGAAIRVRASNPGYTEKESAPLASPSSSQWVFPVGSRQVSVQSTTVTFSVGERVLIRRTPNDAWITAIGADQLVKDWLPADFERDHERTIVNVGSTATHQFLTLDVPLVDAVEARFGGGRVVKVSVNDVQNVGIERLRIDSMDFTAADDHEHTNCGIRFEGVRNSWVRQVTALHFIREIIHIAPGRWNTVEDVAVLDPISIIDGGFRYAFHVRNGVGNLFQRCYGRRNRHTFISHKYASGPNVWLDCVATIPFSDDGPHVEYATGLLFDNILTTKLQVQNAANSDSQGWRGNQVMFWKSKADSFVSDAPPAGMNWGVGNEGPRVDGFPRDEEDGIWQADGTGIPRSLYLQQLRDRLGQSAVNNVTTPAQRQGRIWDKLSAWEGEGDMTPDPSCSTGIPHAGSRTCCLAACGACGASGCSANPAARDNCCTGSILASRRSCLDYGPPCILPSADPKCKLGAVQEWNGSTICCPTGSPNCGPLLFGRVCTSNTPPCLMADPQCTTGIANGSRCCDKMCGRCGGPGCSALPGGSSRCCLGEISDAGRSCSQHPPPCVMP
jgi:hypothetical protein